jgi:hypothetical protein
MFEQLNYISARWCKQVIYGQNPSAPTAAQLSTALRRLNFRMFM